jgi:hypothetical protein
MAIKWFYSPKTPDKVFSSPVEGRERESSSNPFTVEDIIT